ncbi:outer membrane protein assembly factor BamB family protein [Sabulicella glaciei]|uniref:PQQ-binding-like beta-propeller repeat protein n=1 Tax=Sabulicella glaciei TaxID=2984948 RepID=A0ABT3NSF1_9PROT|nr:PQQ-binding-like beta-propeller repeat protein [Roseococcus sp. MDT2-1-1]MCW8085075.1 PQQ-binding-like beta-propeller repeat protein [Roseococcus sp. MDT2-1-1]
MTHATGRRAALLAGAGLFLSGCETTQDLFDRVVGSSKTPLPGERIPILSAERGVEVDREAAERPLVLPAAQINRDWAVAGGTLGHNPGHLSLPSPLGQIWTSSIGTGTAYRRRLTCPPLVAGDTVFAADAYGYVTALDTARGARRWQADTRPRRDRDGALGGAIAFADGTIFAATGLSEIIAIDAGTGTIRWRQPLPAPARGGITVAGGRILVPTVEGQLIGLAAEDGRQVWTFRSTTVQALPLGLPAPAVEGEVAVAGFASGELVALRVADGRVQWSESLGTSRGMSLAEISAITAMPVIDQGRVYAVGMGNSTVAIDMRSGRRVWEREMGGSATPAVAGDWVFVLSSRSELAAIGRTDGRIRWISPLPGFEDEARRRRPITWAAPVLGGGRILVAGSHGQMAEVEPGSGQIVQRTRIAGGTTLQPAIAGNSLYLLTDRGDIAAMRGVG